jgi:integrase/recombinase XerD
MATCHFRSPLAFRLQSFLETRRAAGRDDINSKKILRYLDRFLMSELKPGQPITAELVERWLESMETLSPGTRINRVSILRQFCLYLSHFDPRTCIIHCNILPRRTRPAPYIYTRNDVCRIMAASKRLGGIRGHVVATVVGLLYTTGLRIGEALKLTIGDLDLKRRLIHVRESKFKKSRYVTLSSSTVDQLRAYLHKLRNAGYSTSSMAPLFVAPGGGRYGKATLAAIFLEVIRKIGIRGPKEKRGPRVHDLRHTFAVNRLLAWYRQGTNLSAKLPLLSTYLGHSTVTGTEVYLQATAELLENAGRRFHAHCAIPMSRGKERYEKN